MTNLAVDWVTLSTPEFVGWTRWADVALPFPLSTSDQPYVTAPDREETERILRARSLDESAVLHTARGAFADPRLIVYAVRVAADGRESKYVSVAGQGSDAVLVLLDPNRVAVRSIADTELAAGVVGALPSLTALATPTVEVPLRGLHAVDAAVASGASPRTVHLELTNAGLPPALIAVHEQAEPGPTPCGVLGAVGFGAGSSAGRHSTRSASWREFAPGALLQVERGSQRGEAMVLLTPFTAEGLFRAAVDAVSSLYG